MGRKKFAIETTPTYLRDSERLPELPLMVNSRQELEALGSIDLEDWSGKEESDSHQEVRREVLSELKSVVDRVDVLTRAVESFPAALKKEHPASQIVSTLGDLHLVRFTEAMEAIGISRDMAEKLRESDAIRPVLLTPKSGNPTHYIHIGELRRFSRDLERAPAPSKSRLSKSIMRSKR
jgi:hypothetical protein